MVRESRPEIVIITTIDSTHHQFTTRAMELGCDVICEKPIAIRAEDASEVFKTIEKTGRSLRLTFNIRYLPEAVKVRELVQSGAAGRPTSVDLSWTLDPSHGADYFRRWHREKDKSGGLLVHKASHHFDMVNWWIDSYPKSVFALGDLKFYGHANAESRGQTYTYDRYTGHEQANDDPFRLALGNDPAMEGLYLAAEKETGYVRDRNVFGDGITIEDTMAVTARYRNGVILNYSLLAYAPYEGFRVAINGTRGRIELLVKYREFIPGQNRAPTDLRLEERVLRLTPMFQSGYDVPVPTLSGTHGGSDDQMLEHLLSPNPPADELGQAASHIDGAASLLLGLAANRSIETGQAVDCDSLLRLPD
jgi:predicted dehydrogenase